MAVLAKSAKAVDVTRDFMRLSWSFVFRTKVIHRSLIRAKFDRFATEM
jgi:hypothetical protein